METRTARTASDLHSATVTAHERCMRRSLTDDDWGVKVDAFMRLNGQERQDLTEPFDREHPANLLWSGLLREETLEAHHAHSIGNRVDLIDGLLDTIYVSLGWLLALGLKPSQLLLLMEEVHNSNMTKVDNLGQPIRNLPRADGSLLDPDAPIGKVLKGPNYSPPLLAAILQRFVADAPAA